MNIKLLKKFCSKDITGLEAFLHPFSQGEWTFATNGIIAIRVPRLDAVGEADLAPDCIRLFKTSWRKTRKHLWVGLPDPTTSVNIQGPQGEVRVDSKYIELCRLLPNCKIALTGKESDDSTSPMLLKFDGGDGLLMPMRRYS